MIAEALRDQLQLLQEEVARLGSLRPPSFIATTATSMLDTPLEQGVPLLQKQPLPQALI